MTTPSLDAFWMPFTPNRDFKVAPRLVASAEGVCYQTEDGRSILDGTSGLWCVGAGHRHPKISEAMKAQIDVLDFASSFQVGHRGAFELAERIATLAPPGLDRVFLVNSGSEACDTAMKLALAYWRIRGEGQRSLFVGRERGFHGVGFGGISVGGMVNNRNAFGTSLLRTDHLRSTWEPSEQAFVRGQPEHGAAMADELEKRIIALHGAANIAAVVVEPIAGSTGVLVPPKGYLNRLREICDRHQLLLIFDEVITGFGRTGHMFASETFGGGGGVAKVEARARLLRVAHFPDGEACDLDSLVLRGDLVGGKAHALRRGRDEVVAVDQGQLDEAEAAACAEGFAEAPVERELRGAGDDVSEFFHSAWFFGDTLPGRFPGRVVSLYFFLFHAARIA